MTPSRAVLVLLLSLLAACRPAPAPGAAGGDGPYSRIVTLAPSLAEIVIAAGAGDALVGVSAYTELPPELRSLPLVGDAFTVDQERLALLHPDLLLAWQSGTPEHIADELRHAGYNVIMIRTRTLQEISAALVKVGELAGTPEHAREASAAFDAALDELAFRHKVEIPVRVFYQISARPLYTIGGGHYISELIGICGGENVFADFSELAPAIDVEAVVDRDPEAFVTGVGGGADAFAIWERWPELTANRRGNRFRMPDELGRPTPNVLAAADELCTALAEAYARRPRPVEGDGS